MTQKQKAPPKVGLAYNAFFGVIRERVPGLEVIPFPKNGAMDTSGIIELVSPYDLIVFSGGEDINPRLYGEMPTLTSFCNETRDNVEFNIAKVALRLGKKLFGICRGHQLLNAMQQGTLWQDISLQENSPGYHPGMHKLEVTGVSPIIDIMREADIERVNSMHHQGTRRVGQNMSVHATFKGLPEICIGQNNTLLTVQWHPEFMDNTDPVFKYILEDWVFDRKKSNGDSSYRSQTRGYADELMERATRGGPRIANPYPSSSTSFFNMDGEPVEPEEDGTEGNPPREVDWSNVEEFIEEGSSVTRRTRSVPLQDRAASERILSGTRIRIVFIEGDFVSPHLEWAEERGDPGMDLPISPESAGRLSGNGNWEAAREWLNNLNDSMRQGNTSWRWCLTQASSIDSFCRNLGVPELIIIAPGRE